MVLLRSQTAALALMVALAAARALAQPPPAITWASEPIQPGETLLLAGAHFSPPCTATFSTTSPGVPPASLSAPALPNHTSPGALKFAVPGALPPDVLSLSLSSPAPPPPPRRPFSAMPRSPGGCRATEATAPARAAGCA